MTNRRKSPCARLRLSFNCPGSAASCLWKLASTQVSGGDHHAMRRPNHTEGAWGNVLGETERQEHQVPHMRVMKLSSASLVERSGWKSPREPRRSPPSLGPEEIREVLVSSSSWSAVETAVGAGIDGFCHFQPHRNIIS